MEVKLYPVLTASKPLSYFKRQQVVNARSVQLIISAENHHTKLNFIT
ncbi:hypothetical protein [Bacillus seohaeanensis]